MWRNWSLIHPVMIFLLILVFSTLGVGFAINYSILEDVLRDRVVVKADEVTGAIQKKLAVKIGHLSRFKDTWKANMGWLGEGVGAEEGTGTAIQDQSKRLAQFFPFWGLDFLLTLEASGRVIHQLPGTLTVSPFLSVERMGTVRGHLDRSGHWMTVDKVGDRWSVQVFAPIPGSEGQVVLFGHFLDSLTRRIQEEHADLRFLLAASAGVVGEVPEVSRSLLKRSFVQDVLRTDRAFLDFDDGREWNLYYTPVHVLDRTFCLTVPVGLAATREVLANSRERMVQAAVFLVLVLLLVSYGLNALLLAPLRRLHEKAVLMVEICSADDPEAEGVVTLSRNEIVMLKQALEATTVKLYGHLEKLRESNTLLQKMALKDPVTELLNRRMFRQLLQRSLSICGRNGHRVMVMLMVLDRFAEMEGLLDPPSRDQLLKEIAQRLQDYLRGEDLLCRLDDHSFGAFFPQCCDQEQMDIIAQRLKEAMRQPFSSNGNTLFMSLSSGVSIFPIHGETMEVLIESADQALRTAQMRGGGVCHVQPFSQQSSVI